MRRDVMITYYIQSNATFACSETTKRLDLIKCLLTEVKFGTSQICSEAVTTTP